MAAMTLFFDTIDSLHRFSIGADLNRDNLTCQHCQQSGQFVSHGFVYKVDSIDSSHVVGKRLLCSNRCGKSGCGHTLFLRLADQIPTLHYNTLHLCIFLYAMISGHTIAYAYTWATGACSHRNAFRWLNRLHDRLAVYRTFLQRYRQAALNQNFKSRSHTLQLILSTICRLFSIPGSSSCHHYQLTFQSAII